MTGSEGFFGKYICRAVEKHGGTVVKLPCFVDLRDYRDLYNKISGHDYIDAIIHAAGRNGGISYNIQYPATIFHDNTLMGLNIINAAHECEIPNIMSVVASCAYGDYGESGPDPLRENWFTAGFPNETVACHGLAKRNLQFASHFYNKQYGLTATTACVTTLFGPGDSFDLYKTKVLGALIKKFVDAKDEGKSSVQLWGTGKARRQFIYVETAADLLVRLLPIYKNCTQPVNISTDDDISIRDLAELIAEIVGFDGEIEWDYTKPDGQLRKRLCNKTMLELLGENCYESNFEEELRKTIEYYKSCKK